MKLDPYKHKERYLAWKEQDKDIPNISKVNSDLIKKYIFDMEKGVNIGQGSAKGSRSYVRLCSLKDRMTFFSRKLKELYKIENITEIKEEQLISFFSDLKNGIIKKEHGEGVYKSTDTLARIFKAFWHWYIKVNRKQGKEIKDITLDLDTKQEKPKWVYLTEEQIKLLCNNAKFEYRVLFTFLYDTGIRAPTELMNVKVSDFYNDFKELNIREETSKTFGRRIKLMLASDLIKEYIKTKNLSKESFLFAISPHSANKYLKRLAVKLFGDSETEAGAKYSEISMYDFRHNSCCYWLPRYKSESALKYRFGWKQSDKIHYYSELLGMKDTIAQEDLLIDVTKSEIEQRLTKAEKENLLLREDNQAIKEQLKQILELVGRIGGKIETAYDY